MNKATRKELNRSLWIPRFNTFAFALLMILCIFLPYATATESYAKDIAARPDAIAIEELDLTMEDLQNVSMAKYARIYFSLRNQFSYSGEWIILMLFVVLIVCFALIAAWFAFSCRPIPAIIFTALACGVFALQNWDYTDRGIIPSRYYDWGISHTLLPIMAALTAANAAWLLLEKIIAKKKIRAAASAQSAE